MNEPSAKIVLITEATKGIGFEVARHIGRTRSTILVGAVDQRTGEAAVSKLTSEGVHAGFLVIDLTDPATFQDAAHTIEEKFGRLDILVNNVGIEMRGDPPRSLEALETTLRTNFFGAVSITQKLIPLLRKAPAARIVNVSSGLDALTRYDDEDDSDDSLATAKLLGYTGSWAALDMLTVQLAYELRDTFIQVNFADPGLTSTAIDGVRGTQTISEGVAEIIKLALLPEEGPWDTLAM